MSQEKNSIGNSTTADPTPMEIDSDALSNAVFERNAAGELVPKSGFKKHMDAANANIMDVWRENGDKAAVDAMFTGDNGEQLSYAEMRMRYG